MVCFPQQHGIMCRFRQQTNQIRLAQFGFRYPLLTGRFVSQPFRVPGSSQVRQPSLQTPKQ